MKTCTGISHHLSFFPMCVRNINVWVASVVCKYPAVCVSASKKENNIYSLKKKKGGGGVANTYVCMHTYTSGYGKSLIICDVFNV